MEYDSYDIDPHELAAEILEDNDEVTETQVNETDQAGAFYVDVAYDEPGWVGNADFRLGKRTTKRLLRDHGIVPTGVRTGREDDPLDARIWFNRLEATVSEFDTEGTI